MSIGSRSFTLEVALSIRFGRNRAREGRRELEGCLARRKDDSSPSLGHLIASRDPRLGPSRRQEVRKQNTENSAIELVKYPAEFFFHCRVKAVHVHSHSSVEQTESSLANTNGAKEEALLAKHGRRLG